MFVYIQSYAMYPYMNVRLIDAHYPHIARPVGAIFSVKRGDGHHLSRVSRDRVPCEIWITLLLDIYEPVWPRYYSPSNSNKLRSTLSM